MQGNDLALLTEAAREAGEIARHFWRKDPQTWHKPADDSPVTEADLAIDAMLKSSLMAARPDYGWLSEESPDAPERLSTTRQFIVDPIDGTRAFVNGHEDFAHALAVVEEGQVRAAVVYLPIHDRLYAARLGAGATCNEEPLAVAAHDNARPARILANRASFEPAHWRGPIPAHERAFRASLAHRLALVGEGSFDAMLTLRGTWEWDSAAGSLIAAEAGAQVTDRMGTALRFNQPHPQSAGVIAAPPALHGALIAGLGPA